MEIGMVNERRRTIIHFFLFQMGIRSTETKDRKERKDAKDRNVRLDLNEFWDCLVMVRSILRLANPLL